MESSSDKVVLVTEHLIPAVCHTYHAGHSNDEVTVLRNLASAALIGIQGDFMRCPYQMLERNAWFAASYWLPPNIGTRAGVGVIMQSFEHFRN